MPQLLLRCAWCWTISLRDDLHRTSHVSIGSLRQWSWQSIVTLANRHRVTTSQLETTHHQQGCRGFALTTKIDIQTSPKCLPPTSWCTNSLVWCMCQHLSWHSHAVEESHQALLDGAQIALKWWTPTFVHNARRRQLCTLGKIPQSSMNRQAMTCPISLAKSCAALSQHLPLTFVNRVVFEFEHSSCFNFLSPVWL